MGINRITGSSYIARISRTSSSTLSQISDGLLALSSDISSLISDHNISVYPVLSGLPAGVNETRWNLTSSIDAFKNGLDGCNLFVDNSATSVTNSGYFWSSTYVRPLTVKESILNLYAEIANAINDIEIELSALSSSGLTATQQQRIGINIFNSSLTSSTSSLDGLTKKHNYDIIQIARDLYGSSEYSLDGDGVANLTYSHGEALEALLAIHDGTYDTDITVNHDSVSGGGGGGGGSITGATNEETDYTDVEVVVGGFTLDPTQYESVDEIRFEGVASYIAAGAAGVGYIKLYDLGAPGSTGAGTLRSTLEFDYTAGNVQDQQYITLTTDASPGTDTDEISDSTAVYELRICCDGLGDASDVFQVLWAGITGWMDTGGGVPS